MGIIADSLEKQMKNGYRSIYYNEKNIYEKIRHFYWLPEGTENNLVGVLHWKWSGIFLPNHRNPTFPEYQLRKHVFDGFSKNYRRSSGVSDRSFKIEYDISWQRYGEEDFINMQDDYIEAFISQKGEK